MRNNKLWSVLLAAVLLCACVVGVLIVGAHADGTAYVYSVDGVGSDENCYVDINAAITAAKGVTWAAGDTLTINITAPDTAAANADGTSRWLFKAGAIWRADNTMLPITIDGGTNRYGFGLNGTGYSSGQISCGNNYTFQNMDLTTWGDVSTNFRAGCANVTFNNVDFGTGRNLKFSADCPSKAIFTGWTDARYQAMKEADGYLYAGLTFIDTDYSGSATDLVTVRNWNGGYTVDYNDCAFGVNDVRCRIVIGEGATITNICGAAAASGITEANKSNAYVIDIAGGTISNTLYGIRGGYNAAGDIITNFSAGEVKYFYPGPNTGTLTGNVINNYTGGTVTGGRFVGGSGSTGTITGNVTNNIGVLNQSPRPNFVNNTNYIGGNYDGGAINGTLTNNFYSFQANNLTYCGCRKGTVGDVVNNFYGFWGSGTAGNVVCGGNSTGTVVNGITNNFNGGQFGSYVYCGNYTANVNWGEGTPEYRIVNNIQGGTFYRLICGGANSGVTKAVPNGTVGAVKNTISGDVTFNTALCCAGNANAVGIVDNFFLAGTVTGTVYGGAFGTGATETVNNTFGTSAGVGTCRVPTFYGGSMGASATSTINNTFYAGTIGEEAATTSTSVVSYCGSAAGTVGIINNTFNGGAFNCGWFYGGNANSSVTFDGALHAFVGSECQINNDVNKGAFGRFAAGSNGGVVDTIHNEVGGAAMEDITMYSGALYCGQGANSSTVVNNVFDGCVSNVYGGSNSNALGTVNNSIVAGADITTFYGGNNSSANVGTVNNTVSGGNVTTFYGGYNKPSSGTITAINNTLTGGTIDAFYGGGNTVTPAATDTTINIGSIVNVLDGATVRLYVGGCYDYVAAKSATGVGKYVVGSITNTLTSGTINGNAYLGNRKSDVGDITSTINGVTFRGATMYCGSNSTGSVTGDIATTISALTIGGNTGDSKLVPGCASSTFAGTPTVTITSGATINLKNNGQLDLTGATLTAPDFTLNQTEGWLNKTYFMGDVAAANVTVTGGTYGSYTKTGDCTVKGDAVALDGNASASLVLTSRIGGKIYLNKDTVDAYADAFTYKVAMSSTTLASGNYANLVEEGGQYVIEFAGVGLANFATNISFTTPVFPAYTFTIRSLATAGAAEYASEPVTAAMFQSIADLGTETVPSYNAVTPAPSGSAGAGLITFNGKTLVMADAIGIRLKATEGTKANLAGATVTVNGEDVTALCNIDADGGNIDIYVGVTMMQSDICIVVKDAGGTTCLTLNDQVDWIAQQLINADGTNVLAKQVLAYIQAANAYAATLA